MTGEDGQRLLETQHFPVWGAAVLVGSGVLVAALWATGAGRAPMPGWLAAALLLTFAAIFALFFRMRTAVGRDAIEVSFGWLGWPRFHIPLAEIESCRAVTCRPLRDFGGWGIRFASGGRRALSARGDRAAEIVTARRTTLIGSAAPERLCDAVNRARGA